MLNIKVDVTAQAEVLGRCHDFLSSGATHTIFFLNAHCFNIAQKNHAYFNAIHHADLLLNDGIGVRIASWFAGITFPENLNGTDLIPKILELAARQNCPIFFLGGAQGIAAKAASEVTKKIPGLIVAGTHHGYFQQQDSDALVRQINESGAEILILGMGVPRQELWAYKQIGKLTGVRIILAGGAILDFLSGTIKRAPLWMRKLYLEWLYRLLLEPGRMWKRYLLGGGQFLFFLISLRFRKKWSKKD